LGGSRAIKKNERTHFEKLNACGLPLNRLWGSFILKYLPARSRHTTFDLNQQQT
jgi:hypothetical protein